MRRRTSSLGAWTWWVATMIGLATSLVLTGLDPAPVEDWFLVAVVPLSVIGYATVGALIASRRPGNSIGWLFLLFASCFALALVADGYLAMAVRMDLGPSLARDIAVSIPNVLVAPAFGALPLVVLLFPNGTLPSRRWQPIAWAMAILPLFGVVGYMLRPGMVGSTITLPNPTGSEALRGLASVLLTVAGVGFVCAAVACVVAVVVRFRRATGEERQQIRWLAYTAACGLVVLLAIFASELLGVSSVVTDALAVVFITILTVGIPLASGAAILKYRLYDLDVVLKRAIVFGLLTLFVAVAYAIVVIGIPTLVFGTSGGPETLVPFVVAAVLALAFQPVRRWAGRLANRLVYGRRATPYDVLAQFSTRMASGIATDDVLPRMARMLGEGSGASRAEVWLRVGESIRRAAVWPEAENPVVAFELGGDEVPSLPGADRVVPVRDRGELLGALAVTDPRGESFNAAQLRLIEDLAGQAGLVLRNVRLIEELRASRQRLVAAQDEERRRLERNIHDGAQQQLVALTVKMRLVQAMAGKDPAKAAELAEQAKSELQDALDDLRDLARGIYPPLLADQGLAAALEAQARKAAVAVEVHPDGVGRYSQEVEAGAYFCVLEALQNVAKYAEASHVDVSLRADDGHLAFEVRDDGKGFDPARTPPGSGLTNMRDRLEALGGSVEIASRPGEGTTVLGRIPIGSGA